MEENKKLKKLRLEAPVRDFAEKLNTSYKDLVKLMSGTTHSPKTILIAAVYSAIKDLK